MNSKKNNSVKPGGAPSRAIVMENCHGNSFHNTWLEATNTGLTMSNSSNNSFNDLTVVSPGTLKLITEIKEQVASSRLEKNLKANLTENLTCIEKPSSPKQRLERYKSFMSSLSDHITVLGPIYGRLLELGSYLQQ